MKWTNINWSKDAFYEVNDQNSCERSPALAPASGRCRSAGRLVVSPVVGLQYILYSPPVYRDRPPPLVGLQTPPVMVDDNYNNNDGKI